MALPITLSTSLTLTTPTPGWTLAPVAAYLIGQEHWLIHQLTPPDGMVVQMISETSDTVRFQSIATELPVRHFVLGKTWAWNSNPEVTFIKSLDDIRDRLANAQKLTLVEPE